jgi:4-hydroxybenzoate polyprenyltransferase
MWTIGYDTIYAHQDKEDDLALGLKSTAIRFGDQTKPWLSGLYLGALVLWSIAAMLAGGGLMTALGLAFAGLLLTWQVATLDMADPANCLARFKSNRFVGWLVFAGLIADLALGRG